MPLSKSVQKYPNLRFSAGLHYCVSFKTLLFNLPADTLSSGLSGQQ